MLEEKVNLFIFYPEIRKSILMFVLWADFYYFFLYPTASISTWSVISLVILGPHLHCIQGRFRDTSYYSQYLDSHLTFSSLFPNIRLV